MRTSLLLLGVAGAAALAYTASKRQGTGAMPAPKPSPKVRDAGPEAMTSPPRRWDTTDQQADESFPASDPPGNY